MRKPGQSTRFIMDCIAQGLLELMHEKDYAEISVSEICRRAGVGRTTFYRHFTEGSKDDVLVYYTASLWSDYCETRMEEVAADIWGTLMNFIYDHRAYFTSLGKAQLDHILFTIFYKIIGPARADSLEVSMVKSFLAGAVFGITYHWVITGFVKSPSELAEGIRKSQMQ